MTRELVKSSNFIFYTTPNSEVKLEVFLKDENIWLTQTKIAELFSVDRSVVTKHLQNIYSENELTKKSTSAKIAQVKTEGGRLVNRNVEYYNLDAIISVGYRVNSQRATQFRIWATQTLKEYIIKGFVMNDDRLKQGSQTFGKDYFEELLERVRSIRSSERRMYLKITDIFSECSTDYDPHSQTTKDFFATVQNMFHYAITGQTAAQIIDEKADRRKANMGLTTWKNSPAGRILSTDVVVAKNYLPEDKIKKLERTVFGFFDYIENLIENRQSFTMKEFASSVGKFLSFNEYKILSGKGSVSKEKAEKKALAEYKEFNKTQPVISDFDKAIKHLTDKSVK